MKNSNWTEATQDIETAIIGLLSCQKSGHKAYIEVMDNSKAAFPIKIKNPALNDKENWTMGLGIPTPKDFNFPCSDKIFWNETEKDLYHNYDYTFSRRRCINGHVYFNKDACGGFVCPTCKAEAKQVCGPVKIKDPKNRTWVIEWKPKDGVPYWVADPDIKEVYVVCFDDDEPAQTRNQALLDVADFIRRSVKI